MFIVNQNIINFHLRCDCSFHFVIASFLGVLLGRTAHTKGRSAGRMLGKQNPGWPCCWLVVRCVCVCVCVHAHTHSLSCVGVCQHGESQQ